MHTTVHHFPETVGPINGCTMHGGLPAWCSIPDSVAVQAQPPRPWSELAWQVASPLLIAGAIAALYLAVVVGPSL